MKIIELATAGADGGRLSQLEGRSCEAGVSIIFTRTDVPGAGPYLHQHPYAETFVIHSGRALFTVGGLEHVGAAGEVIVVPGFTAHKFAVVGPELFVSTNIHANDTFVTEWLEGPEADPLA
ncbi:cupin domain-containing protein [Georgenia subflava]|uniref:Cupin domain-containing protein n=1 Tax=Georgenia subflava TaxID=1622177 RepID=A0A6N7EGR1_9MICO|nr:cupin domain-containing protein [Georgenia subflava]MPV36158.1 cupin domain-containing protein [Georgenia subflava]